MTITSHDTYIKLIVSSIDSSREGNARLLLSKGLTASSEVRMQESSICCRGCDIYLESVFSTDMDQSARFSL